MENQFIKSSLFILYVKDQKRSRDFYEKVLQLAPILDVPGMTEFSLSKNVSFGLMPSAGIMKLLDKKIPDPEQANGIPRAELYLRVDDPQKFHQNALSEGGKEIQSLNRMNWGDLVAYSTDPDGHVIAFAMPDKKN